MRASRSPAAMRRATAVSARRPRAMSTAAAKENTTAAARAMSSPPSSKVRTRALAPSTEAKGKLKRATIPCTPATGVAAYSMRFSTVAENRTLSVVCPASAAAISGRRRWFSSPARAWTPTSESPSTRPSSAMKVTRACAIGPKRSASASQSVAPAAAALAARSATIRRRTSTSCRIRSVRSRSTAGKR